MGIKAMIKNTWYVHQYEKEQIDPNLVLLESVNGKDLGNNMLRIMIELSQPEYKNLKLYFSCNKNVEGTVQKLLDAYGLRKVRLVTCDSLAYYRFLSQAGYLINDSTFPRRFIKKLGQIYVNTWHGTPLKRMGADVPQGGHVIGNIQRNLFMCDYLCLPNAYTCEIFRDAYHLRGLYQGEYVYAGYPRNQVFFEKERQREVRKNLLHVKEEERLYCYMPTWRGAGAVQTEEDKVHQAESLKKYLAEMDQLLTDQEKLMIRLHPFLGPLISCESYKHIFYMPEGLDPYEACAAADCLITDYSSVFYDYACKEDGKIVLFLFEREKYQTERAIYGRIEDLPFPAVETVPELLLELRREKNYDDREFLETYCSYEGADSARRICDLVFQGKRDQSKVLIESEPKNSKQKRLFYVGGLRRTGITSAWINLMDNLDLSASDYYVSFQEENLREDPSRLSLIPENVRILAISPGWFLTCQEALASYLYYKKNRTGRWILRTMHRFYQREYKRTYGWVPLDLCLHYSGYERKIIGLYEQADCTRGIMIHSNMEREISLRKNQHRETLREAYREYDFAIAVSEDALKAARAISPESKGIKVIPNCLAWKQVREKAQQPILFGPETQCSRTEEELAAWIAHAREDKEESARLLRAPEDKKSGKYHPRRFVSVGRFSVEKNHPMLLEAFARYCQKHPDAELVIIGGAGELYESTLEKAAELSLLDHVILLKSVANPMPLMAACDLFLLPSSHEGQPMVFMEADVLGVPCAGSAVPGIREFMEEHGGRLFPLSVEGILSAMEAFDRGEIQTLGINYPKWNEKVVREFEKAMR